MKKLIILIIALMSLSSFTSAQQKYDVTQINTSQDPIDFVKDISFVDCNTGYISAVKSIYYSPGVWHYDINYVFKTINGGNTWEKKGQSTDYTFQGIYYALSFSNANTGYMSKKNELYKTTNGGANFFAIPTGYNLLLTNNILCATSNGDVYLTQINKNEIFKYSQQLQQLYYFGNLIYIQYMELSKLNDNTLYVCGKK